MTTPPIDGHTVRLLIAGGTTRLVRAFTRRAHVVVRAELAAAIASTDDAIEAVVLCGRAAPVRSVAGRLKTRFQVPLLPVVAVVPSAARVSPSGLTPDAWLTGIPRPRDVVARVEELVRIRRAEQELVRLNRALTDLAAE